MNKSEAISLGQLINSTADKRYNVIQRIIDGTVMSDFHDWANGKRYTGAYLIKGEYGEAYWFLFIEWKLNRYYLVLYPEKRYGPLLEIHLLNDEDPDNKFLEWNYKPTKRDKNNSARVDYFKKYYLSSTVRISFPSDTSEIADFFDEIFTLLDTRIKSDILDDTEPDFRHSFPEGKRVEHLHKTRERNRKVIEAAKSLYKRKHGKLVCEVCKFDFENKYGKIGEDFIEAHHTLPLSQILNDSVETKIKDIALLCSNCHKMIHRRRPWLTMKEITKLVK